uniref:Cytochrome c oxidase subunit 2 n=1 Tax=Diaphorencyrtus aligarhensis TaxID=436678 RepID=A0A6C0M6P7_9HYME|nr:cytochrome c oxidase subunit II [Diaphorencyrtus aligarhensis]QHU77268.1 cytochrome c oxidase subunit II [Diaphorencyrtus aligarhensis]
MAMWNNLTLQDANSSVMENLILFHDHAMIVIMMMVILISYILFFMFFNKFINRFMFEGQLIEIIWTIVPMFLLFFLVFPSLKILYLTDEIYNPFLSVKVLGHQWYWSYEYSDFLDHSFDSFMISDPLSYNFRLLDVDNHLILPMNLNIRLLVGSTDVIHSFTVPSTGVKVDAVPGRINQTSMNLNRPGLFFGQCSEICGVNHSFMPIVLEASTLDNFLNWLYNFV